MASVCEAIAAVSREVDVLAAVYGRRHFLRLEALVRDAAALALMEREDRDGASGTPALSH